MTVATFISGLPHFDALERHDVDALVAALDVRDCADGAVFVREGTRGDAIFLLLEGAVQVSRERGRSHQELNRLGPGDLFGLIALVDDEPRSASCRALGPAKVGSWPKSVVTLLINQRAPIAHAFQLALATQLARDFRQLDRRVRTQLR
jgi:CRP/FNR family transcriptional regulator, cyclic AMP receptor protein